ncbi:MAG TPA: DUF3035 domain-containing protein [Rhizomicrobium sp.]
MVEYRMRNLSRACILIGAAVALMGCQSIREAAGITKEPPDEFAIVTKAPLIIPPDYNLHPPKPGAAPLNQVAPTTAAQEALYSDDPHAVANAITGNYSDAEKLLLANSGGATSDPTIRRTIAADNMKAEDTDPSLTDSLLFGKTADTSADRPLDADAEKARIDAGQNGAAPAATGKATESATIDKDSSSNNSSGSSWWPF